MIILHADVMRLVIKSGHSICGLCSMPCIMKKKAPIAIIMNAGRAIPSVLRVRIVFIA